MICSYCKTETENTETCDFCQADLSAPRPQRNPHLSMFDAEERRPQPELAKMHTYDLLLILNYIRNSRTDWYRIMQRMRKAPKEFEVEEENITFSIDEYKALTAYKNVIEQILVDRMGYYPKRVDNKLLAALEAKMNQSKD